MRGLEFLNLHTCLHIWYHWSSTNDQSFDANHFINI